MVTDIHARLLYSYYKINGGNPIKAVEKGLDELREECEKRGAILRVRGSCSTGYGRT